MKKRKLESKGRHFASGLKKGQTINVYHLQLYYDQISERLKEIDYILIESKNEDICALVNFDYYQSLDGICMDSKINKLWC